MLLYYICPKINVDGKRSGKVVQVKSHFLMRVICNLSCNLIVMITKGTIHDIAYRIQCFQYRLSVISFKVNMFFLFKKQTKILINSLLNIYIENWNKRFEILFVLIIIYTYKYRVQNFTFFVKLSCMVFSIFF